MKKVELIGTPRTVQGTKGAAQLRREKRVPCVLYGGDTTMHFSVEEGPLNKIVHSPEVYRIELDINGEKRLARLAEKQFHPVSDRLMHVDFIEMSDSKEARVVLSLRLKGQSPGVRKGGKLSQPLRKLRVKGLPTALPEHLELDINNVEVGDSIRVRDLRFDGLTVLERPSDVVVAVKMPKKVEEAAAAPAAAGGAAAPAAAPTAGAAKPAAKPAAKK